MLKLLLVVSAITIIESQHDFYTQQLLEACRDGADKTICDMIAINSRQVADQVGLEAGLENSNELAEILRNSGKVAVAHAILGVVQELRRTAGRPVIEIRNAIAKARNEVRRGIGKVRGEVARAGKKVTGEIRRGIKKVFGG